MLYNDKMTIYKLIRKLLVNRWKLPYNYFIIYLENRISDKGNEEVRALSYC